ncbi:MAG: hypothetical protein NTW85_01755 [Methylococcales bacterium]|nr:hypothetical protein [Methylococcales bacterium]
MSISNKNYALLTTAICIATLSLPAQAWYGGGSGVAYGARGGSAAWNNGAGFAHGPNGGTVAWNNRGYYGGGYRGGAYYGGNYGYSGGQVAGAAVAGLAVGAMIGAAASNNNAVVVQQPSTIVIQQPVSSALPYGSNLTYLPAGCVNVSYNYVQYYQCGMNWLRGNAGYYQVVAAPY